MAIQHNGNTIVEHDGEYYVEVDRAGEVGDLVKFESGRIAKVSPYIGIAVGPKLTRMDITENNAHKTLEPIAQHYAEVEREALDGELVKIVNENSNDGGYGDGDVLLINASNAFGEPMYNGEYISPNEYVVLEPKENAEAQPEDALSLIANLARRVNTLEQDANNFRHDLRTFGEQTEENTQAIAKKSEQPAGTYFSPFQSELLALCHRYQLPRDLALGLVEAAEYAEGERIERAIQATDEAAKEAK